MTEPSGQDTSQDSSQDAIAHLQPHECWAALRGVELGRVGFADEGGQEIFPVNFVVDQGSLVLRTSTASRIGRLADGRALAFEADGYTDGRAWSVVIKGHAKEIHELYESVDAAGLPLHPQQAGPKDRLLRIMADEVTGRRFDVAPASRWDTAVTSARRSEAE
jgi:nitroimidazol reductase NimA-like FMN-containing flavoprotein (pyridoxamine 5'-phosphate oxidase superfamily)